MSLSTISTGTALPVALTVHDVIDRDLVTAVYQPLLHLPSGEVIGYETLARGPAGTALESPLALLDAAREAGRIADLDWACRAAGIRGAMDARLDPTSTLFVNVEPEAAATPCPEHLAPVFELADEVRVRIVVEMTERALAADPAQLLDVVVRIRRSDRGIALDDVGADPASLALLPFVRPDVVKLDMRLVQQRTDADVAAIANAVRAYAEATGAAVLAEGIETREQEAVARTLGATYGQGWLYGRPGPLPAYPCGTRFPLPLAVSGAAAPTLRMSGTPFEVVAASRRVHRSTKSLLLPMSRHLEQHALRHGEAMVVLACFQDARHFTPASAQRFTALARGTAFTAAIGAGLGGEPAPGVRGAALSPGDPLVGEWNVLVVGPHFAGALVARDCGDTGADSDRRFDYVITHDRELVLLAARSLFGWVLPG